MAGGPRGWSSFGSPTYTRVIDSQLVTFECYVLVFFAMHSLHCLASLFFTFICLLENASLGFLWPHAEQSCSCAHINEIISLYAIVHLNTPGLHASLSVSWHCHASISFECRLVNPCSDVSRTCLNHSTHTLPLSTHYSHTPILLFSYYATVIILI
jgi:hypothetical protein